MYDKLRLWKSFLYCTLSLSFILRLEVSSHVKQSKVLSLCECISSCSEIYWTLPQKLLTLSSSTAFKSGALLLKEILFESLRLPTLDPFLALEWRRQIIFILLFSIAALWPSLVLYSMPDSDMFSPANGFSRWLFSLDMVNTRESFRQFFKSIQDSENLESKMLFFYRVLPEI